MNNLKRITCYCWTMLFVLLVFTGTTYAEGKPLFSDFTPCTTWVMDSNSGVKLLVLTSKPEEDEGIGIRNLSPCPVLRQNHRSRFLLRIG